MQTTVIFSVSSVVLGLLTVAPVLADANADMITSAMSAGPAAVSADATIYGMGADGKLMTLREGKNGWWCLPGDPSLPEPDPMCGDANAMAWAQAWMGHTDPPKGAVGFIYMLAGGSGASNTDPYLTKPADGKWMNAGPHVMVMGATAMMAGYKGGANPDGTMPFIMWEGTPYAHLMVPVQ